MGQIPTALEPVAQKIQRVIYGDFIVQWWCDMLESFFCPENLVECRLFSTSFSWKDTECKYTLFNCYLVLTVLGDGSIDGVYWILTCQPTFREHWIPFSTVSWILFGWTKQRCKYMIPIWLFTCFSIRTKWQDVRWIAGKLICGGPVRLVERKSRALVHLFPWFQQRKSTRLYGRNQSIKKDIIFLQKYYFFNHILRPFKHVSCSGSGHLHL
jgi:hypothetical protein